MKTAVVMGASPNPKRFSYKAVNLLKDYGHKVFALGIRKGTIRDTEIITDWKIEEEIHTITLYLRAELQKQYYDFMLGLKPQRIIFNPGTENKEFKKLAKENNIEVIEACTLVMLNTGAY